MKKKSSVKVAVYSVKTTIKYNVTMELLLLHALQIISSIVQSLKGFVQRNIDEVAFQG